MLISETRELEHQTVFVQRNLEKQVLRLELDNARRPWDFPESPKQDQQATGVPLTPVLFPTLGEATGPGHRCFVSASILALKAKIFDDELIAEVEALYERDRPGLLSKSSLLDRLMMRLGVDKEPDHIEPARLDAMAWVWAARRLGGKELVVGREVKTRGARLRREFLDKPQSKPMGIYSQALWLRHVFQRDRFLCSPLQESVARMLAQTLLEDPVLKRAYTALISLTQRLSHPFTQTTLLPEPSKDTPSKTARFLPEVMTAEAELMHRLGKQSKSPDLIHSIIEAVCKGRLQLAPNDDDGWYAHKLNALEPLLKPQQMACAHKLVFTDSYTGYLQGMFEALVTDDRKTLSRPLEDSIAGSARNNLQLAPNLSVEPLPDYYRRRAATYAHIRKLLSEYFGACLLESRPPMAFESLTSNRLQPEPRLEQRAPLAARLFDMERLFNGAANQASLEIGHEEGTGSGKAALQDRLHFKQWLENWPQDPHLGGDPRCMTPLYYDPTQKKYRVTLLCGFSMERLLINFEHPPEVAVAGVDGEPQEVAINWESQTGELIFPVTKQVFVENLMDRENFQTLCNQHDTLDGLLQSLCGKQR